jgi:hypothetical protein
MQMNELDKLNERLTNIIHNTCNKIGCDNCDLKWDDGCSATELQGKIMDIEMKDFKNE